jgi:ABC-type polysaccharide/polyol phosphate transport system ATPase subunit
MPLIEARHVRKSFRIPKVRRDTVREYALALFRPQRYEQLHVLRDISLSLAKGESLGIMGRNGSGKSTLMRILAGIYRPDGGTVEVRAPITPILELGVGWNPELNAIDNICLLGTVMGMTLGEVRRATSEIIEFAGLERFTELALKHYSSGMAARLAYSVAFQSVREVLILDEIFAVGDAEFRQRCKDRYRQLHAAGHSIFLVSHDPYDIVEFCNQALLLENGQVLEEGPADRIAEAYQQLVR